MSQFAFVQPEFPQVHDAARRAEAFANSDPRAACMYARLALELAVTWTYEHDSTLQLPYRDELSALIHEPTFRNLVGQTVFAKCRIIKDLGNEAAHSNKQILKTDAVSAVRELFHVCYWLVRTYARGDKPAPGLSFDPNALPVTATVPRQALVQLKALNDDIAAERERALAAIADRENIDAQLKAARAELEAIKRANAATPDTHNYSEAETRDLFIDLLLREAGWPLDKTEDREYEVDGMPNNEGKGFVDYVLWGRDGKPLGLVEAKRTRRDARVGQQQALLYANCLETRFGQRPVIFYTNGYEHWIWDDAMYPPRPVQGFYTQAELELLIQRRQTRRSLKLAKIDENIADRYYQTRAIRRVSEAFEGQHARRALLVMATGAGKTRTVIALSDVLMRANWAKRILFLADRIALVSQAVGAFKRHLPQAAPVNLTTEKDAEGRVYVSTYPTILNLIDQVKGSERRFGPGHFDLVIIDEAHRSIFMKYGAIFDYFDSLLVGLTATPKAEVGKNTYRMFDLEDGVPTDAYSLQEAIDDHYLVEPKSVSVPLKLPSEGIVYDNLSEEEKEQFELTDWKERDDEVRARRRVEPAAVNQWLFNKETVDKVLRHVMERGLKVEGGDVLGKTIVFAKNHDHAAFIAERFNRNYPRYRGEFARVIDFKTEYAQTLIDDFSNPAKRPQIAISVDMLDTGIDVPEVVNLVFFKQVRSKTKFWQMLGRGTRRCPDLFGPGKDKEFFYIFDYCRNLEFFSQDLPATEGSDGKSLSRRLFAARLHLLTALSQSKAGADIVREHLAQYGEEPATDEQVFESIVKVLQAEVAAMNADNFIVRAKRRLVQKYQKPESWTELTEDKIAELEHEIAGLPTEKEPEQLETKMFDLLLIRLQTAVFTGVDFQRMRKQVVEIAIALEASAAIPPIKAQLPLIQDLQSDDWWQGVSVVMLEQVRLRLRQLVKLIEVRKGSPVFTDFGDEMGPETEIRLPGLSGAKSFERFKEKARAFLRTHLDRAALQKLRMNEPLSASDLAELEAILVESGAGDKAAIERASELGLGLFVRSLVGLDREAAKRALNTYVAGGSLTGSQIDFTNLIVDYLTEHGVMEPRALYESPFTDLSPTGPDGVFASDVVDSILSFLRTVRERAIAA